MGNLYHHKAPFSVLIGPCAKEPEEKHGLTSEGQFPLLEKGRLQFTCLASHSCAQLGLFTALFNCSHSIIDHIVCNGTFAEENDDYAVKRGQCMGSCISTI